MAAINEFWAWFVSHESEFAELAAPDEPFWDLALERLQRVDEHLWPNALTVRS